MRVAVLTMRLDPATGTFDAGELDRFHAGREVLEVGEHFFVHERTPTLALDVLQCLVRARYVRPKGESLREASLALEQLRVLCRVAHDRTYLDHRAFEHLARRLDEAGRMLGGWLRWDGRGGKPGDVAEDDAGLDGAGDFAAVGPEPAR